MPPWLSLSAIKDGVIVIGILLLGWWVYHAGQNSVHVKDIKALQQQIERMSKQNQQWQTQQQVAKSHEQADILAINSGAVVRPLHVKLCPSQPAVQAVLSGSPAAAASEHPQAGGGDLSVKRDIGPALQDYERWLETEFAECRSVVEQWPRIEETR